MDVLVKVVGKSATYVTSVLFLVTLAIRRDAFMTSFFLGTVMNGILSKIFKQLLDIDRPQNDVENAPSDKGMPSTHAMSLSFIGIATILFHPLKWILLLVFVPYGILSLYYRIQARLHTINQILVGCILGTIQAFIWYYILHPHIMTFLTQYILPSNGIIPIPYLILPLLVSLCFDRRFKRFLQTKTKQK